MKNVVTITGIRPDFIRMKNIFESLDKTFNHIMIHTGQHYDDALSKIFFRELSIREPDYYLDSGKSSHNHYEHLSYIAKAVIELFHNKKIKPDIVLFLGDSNTVLASLPLYKEGYRIGHIEGGMRSYDRRMPEEINRVVCDYTSDIVFVYTPLYKQRLIAENKTPEHVFVVGNTITEIVNKYMPKGKRKLNYLVADIHRNENLLSVKQYRHILLYLNEAGEKLQMKVKLVRFNRAMQLISPAEVCKQYNNIDLVGPYGFLDYLELQYGAYGVISDSGTAQEECPLLGVPVVVPRNFTERPESVENGNSILIGETKPVKTMVDDTLSFFTNYDRYNVKTDWLGNGKTSENVVTILRDMLH